MNEQIEIGDEVESIKGFKFIGTVVNVDCVGAYFQIKDSVYIEYKLFSNLKLRRKKMVKEGDVIVNKDGEKALIILANYKYFVRSRWDEFDMVCDYIFLQSDLQKNNWKLYNPDDDLIEVCCVMEGSGGFVKKTKIKKGDARKMGLI